MKQLWGKIWEALVSALPITVIVYLIALTPLVTFTPAELAAFTVGAVLLILGIGLLNLGADLDMTTMGLLARDFPAAQAGSADGGVFCAGCP